MFVNEYSVRVVWRVFEQRGYEVLVSVVRCVCVCGRCVTTIDLIDFWLVLFCFCCLTAWRGKDWKRNKGFGKGPCDIYHTRSQLRQEDPLNLSI